MREFLASVIFQLRIAARTSAALNNIPTALTSLVIVPLISVLMLLFVSVGVTGDYQVETVYASIAVAFGVSIVGGVTEEITRDRNLGIVNFVIQNGVGKISYWAGKVLVPALSGFLTAAVSTLTVVLFLDSSESRFQRGALTLLAIVLVCASGAVIGVACALLTLGSNNPYFLANLLAGTSLVLTGVIIPLEDYPPGLKMLGYLMPFSNAVRGLRGADFLTAACCELLIATLWLLSAVLLTRTVLRRWKSGKIRELIW